MTPFRKRINVTAASGIGVSVVLWVAFYAMVAAFPNGRPVDRMTPAEGPPGHVRATGLIMDLPPDYPASFFTRHAIPIDGLSTRNEIG